MQSTCNYCFHYDLLTNTAVTGITLTLNGVTYPPNSIITMEELGSGSMALTARTTYSPCCTGTDGNWFLPGQSQALSSDTSLNFYQSKTANGEVCFHSSVYSAFTICCLFTIRYLCIFNPLTGVTEQEQYSG